MGRRRTQPTDLATARTFKELKAWPQEALDHLHAAFERKRIGAGPTWAELLGELRKTYGLEWNDSSLSRYYGYWRSVLYVEDRARTEADAILAGLRENPSPDLVAAARQLLQQQRLLALTRMDAADPAEVVRLGLAHDRNEIRAAQVAIDRKRVELLEKKLAAIEAKQVAADKQVGALVEAKEISPEAARKIREVYGLGDDAEQN